MPTLSKIYRYDGQNWVEVLDFGKFYLASNPSGYTSNKGTVTSVGAGTGLSISGTASVNPTVNVASGYKLLTIDEYNNLAKTNIHNQFNTVQTFLKHIAIYDDDSGQEFDYDMFIYSDRISIDNVDSGYEFNYYFPYLDGDTDKDYTLATTEDVDSARIPIYDLT